MLALAAAIAAMAGASAYALTRPDPSAQAQLDGCPRDARATSRLEASQWVYVNDGSAAASGPPPAPQWAKGVVDSPVPQLAAHPAGVDSPFNHRSYDFNFNLRPDPDFASLLGGDEAARTGNFAPVGAEAEEGEQTGRLHVEREEGGLPSFAWPEPGDRVEVLGSWVWDCGHRQRGGERTELHPYRALWVQRKLAVRSPYGETEGDLFISTVETAAGRQADCAHKAKGERAAFKACLAVEPDWQDVNGAYRFLLPAPPRPSPKARLRVRVVDAGSAGRGQLVDSRTGAGTANVTVGIAAPAGQRVIVAKQVFVGWLPVEATALPLHLRVSFQELLIRRAMDPGCPNASPGCGSVESTREDQISAPPGEWLVYWDVAGIWGRWRPTVLRVRDGQVVTGRQAVDLYVPRGRPWRLLTYARECDFGAVNIAPCPPYRRARQREGRRRPGRGRAAVPLAGGGRRRAESEREARQRLLLSRGQRGGLLPDHVPRRARRRRGEAGCDAPAVARERACRAR